MPDPLPLGATVGSGAAVDGRRFPVGPTVDDRGRPGSRFPPAPGPLSPSAAPPVASGCGLAPLGTVVPGVALADTDGTPPPGAVADGGAAPAVVDRSLSGRGGRVQEARARPTATAAAVTRTTALADPATVRPIDACGGRTIAKVLRPSRMTCGSGFRSPPAGSTIRSAGPLSLARVPPRGQPARRTGGRRTRGRAGRGTVRPGERSAIYRSRCGSAYRKSSIATMSRQKLSRFFALSGASPAVIRTS